MRKLLFVASVLFPNLAYAGVLTINSPDVKKGEVAIEAGTIWQRDGDKPEDHKREHTLELEYSFTNNYKAGVDFIVERESALGTNYTITAIENTFQFFKQSEAVPLSLGIRLDYETAYLEDAADAVEARLLLRHKCDKFEYRANIGLKKEIGEHAEGGLEGLVRTSARYKYNDYLTPAIDYLGNIGPLHELQGLDNQGHRIGPVLYGQALALDYEIGYFAGLTPSSADHTFKLNVAYKFSL